MKDVVIKIVGTQNYGDNDDGSIELVTDGKYAFADGKGEIFYSESELTGLEGTKTRLSISPLEVILRREGNMTSSTVFSGGAAQSVPVRHALRQGHPWGGHQKDQRQLRRARRQHGDRLRGGYGPRGVRPATNSG
jgi:hypothetical protein